MLLFLFGFLIVVLGGYILISLIQLAFMIIGWIIQTILQYLCARQDHILLS